MNYFVTVDVSGIDPRQLVNGLEARMQNLKPVLNVVPEQVIFPSVEKSFAAQGRPAWRFKGYQSSPPMIKTGLMKRGLTTRDAALNTITVTDETLTFELNRGPYVEASRAGHRGKMSGHRETSAGVFYPGIHQHGGKRHYQNIVLNLQPEDAEKIERLLLQYLTSGKVGG